MKTNPKKHRLMICSAIVSAFVLLTGMMSGCNAGSKTSNKTPIDPTAIIESDHNLFEGMPFEEAPVIPELRSNEEIAATGLTTEDVLNAYDQLATEIAKVHYDSSPFGDVTQKMIDATVAQFVSITPSSFIWDDENGSWTAPFFALNPEHCAMDGWNGPWGASDVVPAYGVTINITAYTDGVRIETCLPTAGVEQSAFEEVMKVFDQKLYQFDYDAYRAIVEQDENNCMHHYRYLTDFDKEVYEGLTITRETIVNANGEQLEALYAMIPSLRSILLTHKLPG